MTSGTLPSWPASASVAGSFGWSRSRTLTCPIQTEPSPVRTSIAPRLRCSTVPGLPVSAGPGWASNTETAIPLIVARTPGEPSAARIRRTMAAVGSAQENSRSDWRISGRSLPRMSGAA